MTAGEDTTISLLIVEDDAMVLGWVTLALAGSEFEVAGTASTAAEALALATRRRPEALLVDFRLPDRTGTELVRDLRLAGIVKLLMGSYWPKAARYQLQLTTLSGHSRRLLDHPIGLQ